MPASFVYSDHNPLVFLHSSENPYQHLMRWALFIQPYQLASSQRVSMQTLTLVCCSYTTHFVCYLCPLLSPSFCFLFYNLIGTMGILLFCFIPTSQLRRSISVVLSEQKQLSDMFMRCTVLCPKELWPYQTNLHYLKYLQVAGRKHMEVIMVDGHAAHAVFMQDYRVCIFHNPKVYIQCNYYQKKTEKKALYGKYESTTTSCLVWLQHKKIKLSFKWGETVPLKNHKVACHISFV